MHNYWCNAKMNEFNPDQTWNSAVNSEIITKLWIGKELILQSSAKPKLEALASALAEISFNFDFTPPPHPQKKHGKLPKLEKKLPNTIPNRTTSMEDNINGRGSQWKTISMEDNINRRQHQWKKTSMEDNLIVRRPQWMTTSIEEDLNGRLTQLKMTTI